CMFDSSAATAIAKIGASSSISFSGTASPLSSIACSWHPIVTDARSPALLPRLGHQVGAGILFRFERVETLEGLAGVVVEVA
ncbi:hypothetical protein ABTF26_21270, partial [Acinetobacter baumannii]